MPSHINWVILLLTITVASFFSLLILWRFRGSDGQEKFNIDESKSNLLLLFLLLIAIFSVAAFLVFLSAHRITSF
jgi:heme/copper-type cytochrome/quinol oxidase subunit 2